MKTFLGIVLAMLVWPAVAEQYGAEIRGNEVLDLEQAIDKVQTEGATRVVMKGEVSSVCQAKGCWMGFSSEAGDLRVTFKDYGFFVPLHIVGKDVLVEGVLEEVELSLEESRHLAEDAGRDPQLVTEATKEYRLLATGVKVQN